MIQYRRILELHFKGTSQRTISSSVGHSRQTVSDVVIKANHLGLVELTDEMTNQWLAEFLFPEKEAIAKGYFPVDWEDVHREPQKKNMTLKLLHYEYSQRARDSKKIPYAYRTFCRHYGKYANKYKLTMPISVNQVKLWKLTGLEINCLLKTEIQAKSYLSMCL
jgi:hypothetical protein